MKKLKLGLLVMLVLCLVSTLLVGCSKATVGDKVEIMGKVFKLDKVERSESQASYVVVTVLSDAAPRLDLMADLSGGGMSAQYNAPVSCNIMRNGKSLRSGNNATIAEVSGDLPYSYTFKLQVGEDKFPDTVIITYNKESAEFTVKE